MGLIATRPYALEIYDPETDTTPKSEIVRVLDHPDWLAPKIEPYLASTQPSDVILGTEIVPSTGWTATGWAGSFAVGFTHTAGNTTPLSNTIAAIIDNIYQISLVVTGRTAGTFVVSFGGIDSQGLSVTDAYSLKATTNDNLIITPTTDFDGTIVISIKQVTWEFTGAEVLTLLGKDALYSQTESDARFVAIVSGSGLITDAEKTRLSTIYQNGYKIILSASADVATRISGGITVPSGWTLAAVGDLGNDLEITHTLTGVEIDTITVKTTDTGNRTLVPFMDAYSGIFELANVITIEGLAKNVLPLIIILTFK